MARVHEFTQALLNGHPGDISDAAKSVIPRAHNGGLVVTATTDGVHAPTSYHALGQAVDFGVEPSEVGTQKAHDKEVRFQRFLLHEFGVDAFWELLGPDNDACVLRGQPYTLPEGSDLETQHDNHVHVVPKRSLPLPKAGQRTLHPGMSGDDVKQAQKLLKAKGYFPHKTGKRYGANMHAAVNAFKVDNGLPRDGAVGPRVWRMLEGGGHHQRTLHPGMHGDDVRRAMVTLQHLGFFPKGRKVGRSYGAVMHKAVNDFKHAHKLPQDGAVGPRVWRLLGKGS